MSLTAALVKSYPLHLFAADAITAAQNENSVRSTLVPLDQGTTRIKDTPRK